MGGEGRRARAGLRPHSSSLNRDHSAASPGWAVRTGTGRKSCILARGLERAAPAHRKGAGRAASESHRAALQAVAGPGTTEARNRRGPALAYWPLCDRSPACGSWGAEDAGVRPPVRAQRTSLHVATPMTPAGAAGQSPL